MTAREPADSSNVPGVALYFYMLSAIRHELTLIPYFARASATGEGRRSALAQLSSTGNLVAGAVARTSVGFVLNPITVIKARFEVSASKRAQRARRRLFQPGGWRRLERC
jgi:solute carrier family 25 protein 38